MWQESLILLVMKECISSDAFSVKAHSFAHSFEGLSEQLSGEHIAVDVKALLTTVPSFAIHRVNAPG